MNGPTSSFGESEVCEHERHFTILQYLCICGALSFYHSLTLAVPITVFLDSAPSSNCSILLLEQTNNTLIPEDSFIPFTKDRDPSSYPTVIGSLYWSTRRCTRSAANFGTGFLVHGDTSYHAFGSQARLVTDQYPCPRVVYVAYQTSATYNAPDLVPFNSDKMVNKGHYIFDMNLKRPFIRRNDLRALWIEGSVPSSLLVGELSN